MQQVKILFDAHKSKLFSGQVWTTTGVDHYRCGPLSVRFQFEDQQFEAIEYIQKTGIYHTCWKTRLTENVFPRTLT